MNLSLAAYKSISGMKGRNCELGHILWRFFCCLGDIIGIRIA
jgi:hypothetical protein